MLRCSYLPVDFDLSYTVPQIHLCIRFIHDVLHVNIYLHLHLHYIYNSCNKHFSARDDKEVWRQKQRQDIEIHTGDKRCRESYRVIKQINRK